MRLKPKSNTFIEIEFLSLTFITRPLPLPLPLYLDLYQANPATSLLLAKISLYKTTRFRKLINDIFDDDEKRGLCLPVSVAVVTRDGGARSKGGCSPLPPPTTSARRDFLQQRGGTQIN